MAGSSNCKLWFAPNANADEWASKLVLVKGSYDEAGKLPYILMENAPCWVYKTRSDADGADAVTRIMTTYSGGCWYGVCRHHAYVYTSIFQERTKGQYHTVGGYRTKAVMVRISGHIWVEVYIEGMGYHVIDVCGPRFLVPRSNFGNRLGTGMCNRWINGNLKYGTAPYQWLWAGAEAPPYEPPEKTYIKATTTPSNANIWLKKR